MIEDSNACCQAICHRQVNEPYLYSIHFFFLIYKLITKIEITCEGKIGYIRYSVHVVFDIPFWPDKEFAERFIVVKPLDLNDDAAVKVSLFLNFSVFYVESYIGHKFDRPIDYFPFQFKKIYNFYFKQ